MDSERDYSAASLEHLLAALDQPQRQQATDAIKELIRRFRPMLTAMHRKCSQFIEYQDFCQEVFVRLFRNLHGIQPPLFPGYMHAMAQSVAADALSKGLVRREDRLEEAILSLSEPDIVDRLIVGSLLDKLSARDRRALELYYYAGLSDAEAAPLLNLRSPGAVRKLRSQAVASIREIALRQVKLPIGGKI